MAVSSSIELEWTPEFSAYPDSYSGDIKALCSLKAPMFKPEQSQTRGRLDLVAVIDVSDSMNGTSLTLVKESLEFMINELGEFDRFGLVTFHDIAEVEFSLTYMTPANKEEKIKVVRALTTKGFTNLCEGLMTGMYEIIDRPSEKGDVASVLLFTDGQANRGITDKKSVLKEMRKAINPPKQFIPFKGTVNTFGFGSSHDNSLLKVISEEGIGVYHYIPDKTKLKETMLLCFGGLISTLSKDITLKFTSVDDNVIMKIHTAREPEWKVTGKTCIAKIGDLQSEETRDILVEMRIPCITNSPDSVVFCELKYFNVITSSLITANSTLYLTISSELVKRETNIAVDVHNNRLLVTQAMKTAQQLAEKEKLREAKQVLQDAKGQITGSVSRNEELSQKLITDLNEVMKSMVSSSLYKSYGAHYLVSSQQSHSMQRMTGSDGSYGSQSKQHYVKVSKN